ncbi:PQQ-binding-like beta-propeller repeat protein [Qipengyuania sediminis]|uniref:outer membrane protein assembly factor BamB family protein n=1 Tax=Qipengyuania sediminis TaxID=1532023 RepID=UPI001059BC27|nr:PQQ-binding-like beta-propeller repeat protein [Qipengyuania sediminis]
MTSSRTVRPLRLATAGVLALALAGCAGGLFGGGDKKKTPTLGDRVPILSRIESGAKVDPALAAVPVALPAATVNVEWTQPGGSASKAAGHFALAAAPQRVWSAQVVGATNRARIASAPVVGGGRLYAVGSDGAISAFDAATGARVWVQSADVGRDLRSVAFGGGVSYSDGRVYATNGAGEVLALDAATGAVAWRVKPAGPLRGAPTVDFGSVYVMTQDNQILALESGTGKLQWQESASSTASGVFGVAAPAAGQGTVIAGYSSGELVAYRYENGRTLWSDALARTNLSTSVGALTDIDADPIIDSGRVYALGQGGRMAAYELVTGQRIWELNLAGISTPALSGDWIFTLTDDARLLAIARASGKVRWITQLARFRDEEDRDGPITWQGPVLAGDALWTVNSAGQIYRITPADGAATLFTDLKQPISLAPIVANSTLYVLDDSGRIHAFR